MARSLLQRFMHVRVGVSTPLCIVSPRPWLHGGLQRQCATTSGDRSVNLVCRDDTNLGKLAGAIAERIRAGGATSVDALGPNQTHKVLKSMLLADSFLKEKGGHDGKQLAVTPEKVFTDEFFPVNEQLAADVGRTQRVIMRLHMQLVEGTKADKPDIKVAESTNTGRLGITLARRLKASDSSALGGMGAAATSIALKAMLVAQAHLKGTLTDGRVLAASLCDEKIKEGKEEYVGMIMNCSRAPAPPTWST